MPFKLKFIDEPYKYSKPFIELKNDIRYTIDTLKLMTSSVLLFPKHFFVIILKDPNYINK